MGGGEFNGATPVEIGLPGEVEGIGATVVSQWDSIRGSAGEEKGEGVGIAYSIAWGTYGEGAVAGVGVDSGDQVAGSFGATGDAADEFEVVTATFFRRHFGIFFAENSTTAAVIPVSDSDSGGTVTVEGNMPVCPVAIFELWSYFNAAVLAVEVEAGVVVKTGSPQNGVLVAIAKVEREGAFTTEETAQQAGTVIYSHQYLTVRSGTFKLAEVVVEVCGALTVEIDQNWFGIKPGGTEHGGE